MNRINNSGENDYWEMPDMDKTFEELIIWFTSLLIVTEFALTNTCNVDTDASDFALGAIFS
jgi:hypothetical protein